MRLFLGGFLPQNIRENIVNQTQTGSTLSSIRWTRPEHLHMTIKFMGDVENRLLPQLISTLKSALLGASNAQLRLQKVGFFPSLQRPSLGWLGVEDMDKTLTNLHGKVEQALEECGVHREQRKFHPHVTVARGRNKMISAVDTQVFCKLYRNFKSPMFSLENLQLIHSQLSATGSTYTTLEQFSLGPSE